MTSAIEPFGAERFDVGGSPCDVHPKAAVSLSMVLHELATNAVKHGALSVPSGTVRLEWDCKHGDKSHELELTWQERGGPVMAQPTHRGFGTRLIQRQLALEFGGKAALDFEPSGLVCRMRLQMPANPDAIELQTPARPVG